MKRTKKQRVEAKCLNLVDDKLWEWYALEKVSWGKVKELVRSAHPWIPYIDLHGLREVSVVEYDRNEEGRWVVLKFSEGDTVPLYLENGDEQASLQAVATRMSNAGVSLSSEERESRDIVPRELRDSARRKYDEGRRLLEGWLRKGLLGVALGSLGAAFYFGVPDLVQFFLFAGAVLLWLGCGKKIFDPVGRLVYPDP